MSDEGGSALTNTTRTERHDTQLFDNPEFYQITYFQIDLTMRSAVKYMRSDVMYVGAKGL